MWARHLGVPHLWPSRVKVFFLGLLTSVFIFSVFQYLHNANVEYLDLESPAAQDIACRLPIEVCRGTEDPVQCTIELGDHRFWRGLNLSDPCPTLPSSLKGQTCRNPSLPLVSIVGDNGSLHTVNSSLNPFQLWSILFLALTSLLSMSILIHDMALLEDNMRPTILSIPKLRYAVPCLWDWFRTVQCRTRMQQLWSRNRPVWYMLIAPWGLFQAVLFMAIMYPFSLIACLFISPVRMSRIMVFLSGILCMLWSIVFVMVTTLFDTQPYAVLWSVSEPGLSCVCLCEFPLSKSVVMRIVALGVGMCWHSLSLTLRALKGLRRGQWANMFSVLHAVPIEAYPVRWDRSSASRLEIGLVGTGASVTPAMTHEASMEEPGSKPIRWRHEGEPVQSEPAFDPFCLMDEQPESAWTFPLIVPVNMAARGHGMSGEFVEEQQQMIWEPYTGNLDTEIGCCGFPLPPSRASDDDEYSQRGSRGDGSPLANKLVKSDSDGKKASTADGHATSDARPSGKFFFGSSSSHVPPGENSASEHGASEELQMSNGSPTKKGKVALGQAFGPDGCHSRGGNAALAQDDDAALATGQGACDDVGVVGGSPASRGSGRGPNPQLLGTSSEP